MSLSRIHEITELSALINSVHNGPYGLYIYIILHGIDVLRCVAKESDCIVHDACSVVLQQQLQLLGTRIRAHPSYQ